jgi:hypothetical protein
MYHVVSGLLGSMTVEGFAGLSAWSDWGGGSEVLDGLDRAILAREADFVTPLFDHAARGFRLKLVGEVDFEGSPAIGVEVDRGDGSAETWYLDPRSFLALARVSPGNDVFGPVERRTYYDDYRDVDGVKLPFYVEAQWYTRQFVYEVASVETNVAVDDAKFGLPLPPGMAPLAALAGSWKVALSSRQHPGAPWEESERTSQTEARLRGALIEERYATAEGIEVVRCFTYDQFHKKYRVTQIDGRRTQLDVYEGDFDDSGRWVVSNVATGTSWSGFGMVFHTRLSISDIGPDGFTLEHETSTDGGETWFLDAKAAYARAE